MGSIEVRLFKKLFYRGYEKPTAPFFLHKEKANRSLPKFLFRFWSIPIISTIYPRKILILISPIDNCILVIFNI